MLETQDYGHEKSLDIMSSRDISRARGLVVKHPPIFRKTNTNLAKHVIIQTPHLKFSGYAPDG